MEAPRVAVVSVVDGQGSRYRDGMTLVAAVLGAVVLLLGAAVAIVGVRRRQGRVVALGLVGVALGLAVLVPVAITGVGAAASEALGVDGGVAAAVAAGA